MAPFPIPDDMLATMFAQACESFPAECCGYIVGSEDRATRIVRCRNAQADGEHPTHPERGAELGFVIAGRELFEFARSFGSPEPARVVYHSHTNGRAYFSAVDRVNAITPDGAAPSYPVQHLVIGVKREDAGAVQVTEAAMFAWSPATGDYTEIARWTVGEAGFSSVSRP